MKKVNEMSVRVYEKYEKRALCVNKEDLIVRKIGNDNLKVIADRYGIFSSR